MEEIALEEIKIEGSLGRREGVEVCVCIYDTYFVFVYIKLYIRSLG